MVAWWWIGEIVGYVVSVAAGLIELLELGEKGAIEPEQVVVCSHQWNDRNFLLCEVPVANARVVHQGAGEVEMGGVVLVEHGGGYVWDVSTSVRLACDVDLEVGDVEYGLEILEEIDEIGGHLFFIRDVRRSRGIACADRLIDPENMFSTELALTEL